jgi:hypothetical protein
MSTTVAAARSAPVPALGLADRGAANVNVDAQPADSGDASSATSVAATNNLSMLIAPA